MTEVAEINIPETLRDGLLEFTTDEIAAHLRATTADRFFYAKRSKEFPGKDVAVFTRHAMRNMSSADTDLAHHLSEWEWGRAIESWEIFRALVQSKAPEDDETDGIFDVIADTADQERDAEGIWMVTQVRVIFKGNIRKLLHVKELEKA
ncbi:hypothetical protein HOG48_02670 [Candidatus Peregrinibacteria bacterium]|jgi:hypothetical protein|nr:hypothetical protein [Candidatus Peregrinibacteria bacterium]